MERKRNHGQHTSAVSGSGGGGGDGGFGASDGATALARDTCDAGAGINADRIGLASYSLWQFTNGNLRDLKKNLDLAAQWGFAGIEVLERQIGPEHEKDKAYMQGLKRHAAINGLDLYGLATHQTFLTPDEAMRSPTSSRRRLEIHLELAYSLGIPTMRVQTGTWGTSKNFDDLMAHRGIGKPPLEGAYAMKKASSG